MDYFDYAFYFTVELKAGDTLTVAVFGEHTSVGIIDFVNYYDCWLDSVDTSSVYEISVEQDGNYVLYVGTDDKETFVKAFKGEIEYSDVEGATDAAYYTSVSGFYRCKIRKTVANSRF